MNGIREKYVNPLTDFGFKKLFGTEALQEKVFKKLFEAAEIAKFTSEEKEAYEESLKYYRDLKNVVDTSREEGIEQGIEQGKIEVAIELKKNKVPIEIIMKSTGLSKEEIENL